MTPNHSSYSDKINRWSSHSRIAGIINALPVGVRILDVGAGTGTLARMCANRGYEIRGIEPHSDWLTAASNLYTEIYTGNLEQTPDIFLRDNDAVVCGDVLEHLVDPVTQLSRLVNLQPDSCLFLISVPNIANIWIRLNLLIGRFNYSDRGIMDRTHLHFFTKKTFMKFLQGANLQIIELHATPIPLDLVSPYFILNPIGQALYTILARFTTRWPTLLGYQWIAIAKKSGN